MRTINEAMLWVGLIALCTAFVWAWIIVVFVRRPEVRLGEDD